MKTCLLAAGAVAVVLLAPVTAIAAPPPECHGLPATIIGTDGNDDLRGTSGDDVVSLGDGNDRFEARDGDDVVCGGAGIDDLYGQLGDDLLDGGEGRDSLWDDTAGGAVAGGDGADVLLGGPDDDALWLSGGDGVGDGAGADTADGGEGRDAVGYLASPVGVEIDVNAGAATGTVGTVDTFTAVEGPYAGSPYADVLRGTPRADQLYAGRAETGRDRVFGRAGNDELRAEVGLVDAGRGRDVYQSENETQGEIELQMGGGDDYVVLDQGGPVSMWGGPGVDLVAFRPPHDAAPLRARLRGGPDDDGLVFVDVGRPVRADLASGEASYGRARVRFRYFDSVAGGVADDVLLGSSERDRIFGFGGDDLMRGRGGPDYLKGDGGRDTAYGGPGRDRCLAERERDCETG